MKKFSELKNTALVDQTRRAHIEAYEAELLAELPRAESEGHLSADRLMTSARMADRLLPNGTVESERTDAAEWDQLATALNDWGVLHVIPGRRRKRGVPHAPADLFRRLALSSEARLQQAVVVLLLTHPELADDARAAIDGLVGAVKDRAMRRYVAASALQRMARTRIAERLGSQPLIPAAYLDVLAVASLDEEFGRATLLDVANQEEARYEYDAWNTYRTLLDLFLAEIRRRDWGRACGSALTAPA